MFKQSIWGNLGGSTHIQAKFFELTYIYFLLRG